MLNVQLLVVLLLLGLIGTWAGVLLPREPGEILIGPHQQRGLGIYGGNITYIEDHPYLVSVTYDGVIFCAGTIVSRSWVLLLADCLNGYELDEMSVVAGSRDGQRGSQQYGVSQSVQHPDYDYYWGTNNYGLIQINGNFTWGTKVKKVKLPKHRAKVGTWLTMTGYGESEANGVLRAGRTQVISRKDCFSIYEGYSLNLTSTKGCVYNKGETTICSGDVGDPLTKDGVLYHLTGAIGTPGYCSSSAMPVITSDVYGAVAWIKKISGIE